MQQNKKLTVTGPPASGKSKIIEDIIFWCSHNKLNIPNLLSIDSILRELFASGTLRGNAVVMEDGSLILKDFDSIVSRCLETLINRVGNSNKLTIIEVPLLSPDRVPLYLDLLSGADVVVLSADLCTRLKRNEHRSGTKVSEKSVREMASCWGEDELTAVSNVAKSIECLNTECLPEIAASRAVDWFRKIALDL